MKPTLIISPYNDPAINLAFEEILVCQQDQQRHILFLYQNAHTIVIGCNQNPWKECNVKAFKRAGGKIIRRLSGGGAVYHDLGNLNFSFIRPAHEHHVEDNYLFVKKALHKLGFNVILNGKNDLVIDDKKFSGSAFYEEGENYCHHGTILINSDLSTLSQYLTPPKIKIESKAIASVRARVVNLDEIIPGTHVEKVKNAFVETFKETYAPLNVEYLDVELTPELKQRMETYQSTAWLYDQSPSFNVYLEKRFSWGTFELACFIRDGVIEDIKCYTDALKIKVFREIEIRLTGCEFQYSAIKSRLNTIDENRDIIEDLCNMLEEMS